MPRHERDAARLGRAVMLIRFSGPARRSPAGRSGELPLRRLLRLLEGLHPPGLPHLAVRSRRPTGSSVPCHQSSVPWLLSTPADLRPGHPGAATTSHHGGQRGYFIRARRFRRGGRAWLLGAPIMSPSRTRRPVRTCSRPRRPTTLDELDQRYHPAAGMRKQSTSVFRRTGRSCSARDRAVQLHHHCCSPAPTWGCSLDPSMQEVTYNGVFDNLRGFPCPGRTKRLARDLLERARGLFVRQIHHWRRCCVAPSDVSCTMFFARTSPRVPQAPRDELGDRDPA